MHGSGNTHVTHAVRPANFECGGRDDYIVVVGTMGKLRRYHSTSFDFRGKYREIMSGGAPGGTLSPS